MSLKLKNIKYCFQRLTFVLFFVSILTFFGSILLLKSFYIFRNEHDDPDFLKTQHDLKNHSPLGRAIF